MIKKIFIIILSLSFYSCGFKPMLKSFNISDLNIEEIKYSGPNEMTYMLKNLLNLNEKAGSKGVFVNLSITEETLSVTKNSSGITTEQDLIITININISDNKKNNLLKDSISERKRLIVSNNMANDEDIKKIEKNNIIRSLAQKTKFKIQLAAENK